MQGDTEELFLPGPLPVMNVVHINDPLIDWLIDYIFHLYGDVTITGVQMDAEFRPIFDIHSLWVGKDLFRATPAVTQDLSFFRSHPKDRPWSRLTTHKGMRGTYSNPDPHGLIQKCDLKNN
jgi:hypothetical protein